MKTYEVREYNKPYKAALVVEANSPKEAVENLLIDGRWYTLPGVTELIEVQERATAGVVLALSSSGLVTETI